MEFTEPWCPLCGRKRIRIKWSTSFKSNCRCVFYYCKNTLCNSIISKDLYCEAHKNIFKDVYCETHKDIFNPKTDKKTMLARDSFKIHKIDFSSQEKEEELIRSVDATMKEIAADEKKGEIPEEEILKRMVRGFYNSNGYAVEFF